MIRSGEHELWDAHMACGRARAERDAFAARLAPVARAMQHLGKAMFVSVEQAAKALGEFGIAYERAMRNAAASLAAQRRVGSTADEIVRAWKERQ